MASEKGRRQEVTISLRDTVELAKALHKGGRLDDAEPLYERILEGFPDQVEALHFLGVLRHQQHRHDEAIDLIRRALDLDPDYVDARNNLGNLYRLTGDLDGAEREYRRVLDAAPKHADTWNNLGTILYRRKDFDGATNAYRKTLEINEHHGEAWQNLGNQLRRQGKFDEAAEAYRKALALRPEKAQLHLSLGRSLWLTGRKEDAAAVYQSWLETEPENPIASHMLAACTGGKIPARASDEFVTQTFDAFSADFDEVLTRLDYKAPELVATAMKKVLPGRKTPCSILDAGCGTGLCGPLLRPFASELVGVDLSGAMLSRAQTLKIYDDLEREELTAYLARHEDRFDGIASADVFVYFGDLSEVLRAAAEALRPEGAIVFTTERAEETEGPDGYTLHPAGRYRHTESYLGEALAAAGLAPRSFAEVRLRMEGGEPVTGTLAVAVREA